MENLGLKEETDIDWRIWVISGEWAFKLSWEAPWLAGMDAFTSALDQDDLGRMNPHRRKISGSIGAIAGGLRSDPLTVTGWKNWAIRVANESVEPSDTLPIVLLGVF